MNGLEIIQVMVDIHSISKNPNQYDEESLSAIYQDLIKNCPRSESRILKTLRSDLKRITEYGHKLPDLLSLITWTKLYEENKEKSNGE